MRQPGGATAIKLFFMACLAACAVLLNSLATSKVFETQPKWYFLTPHSYKKFSHILGVGFGYRALLADFEYINFLQYYGNREHMEDKFPKLYEMINDITDADPHFAFAYTYGSAILGFNLKRHDEAIALIKKGLEYNPSFWKLRFYLAAITYNELDDKENYVKYLEEALKFNDRPAMIETLLGNIYEQYKPADFCAEYWVWVYKNTSDARNRDFAYKRILAIIESGRLKNPGKIRL
ncbi:MAG TPA: hypothetical protein P5511_06075 [Candidatus Goldiibacteriota bacterium]|nr:hypothetical protein [Candidatus Goldiibacteriota bacterium]